MREVVTRQPDVHSDRILLVGFSRGFPDFLRRLLQDEYQSISFEEATTVSEAVATTESRPSLVLLDETCCRDATAMKNELERVFSHTIVAVTFSGHSPSPECLKTCVTGGVVSSFLPMDMRIEVWLAAIGLMLKGGRYVPPCLMDDFLSERLMNGPVSRPVPQESGDVVKEIELLTPRELEVLGLVARGLQNKIIAADLGLSENTVKLHLHHIIKKLNTTNRTEAAACYHVHMAAKRIDGSAH